MLFKLIDQIETKCSGPFSEFLKHQCEFMIKSVYPQINEALFFSQNATFTISNTIATPSQDEVAHK